jgi:hypothetical protein
MATAAHTLDQLLVERLERLERKLDELLGRAPVEEDEAIGKRRAAKILHLDRAMLDQLIQQGAIRAKPVGRYVKIARSELQRVLREGTEVLAPPPPPEQPARKRRSRTKHQSPEDLEAEIRGLDVTVEDDDS